MYGYCLECLIVIDMKKMESQNLQLLVDFMAVQLYLHLEVNYMFQNCLRGAWSSFMSTINENYTACGKEKAIFVFFQKSVTLLSGSNGT